MTEGTGQNLQYDPRSSNWWGGGSSIIMLQVKGHFLFWPESGNLSLQFSQHFDLMVKVNDLSRFQEIQVDNVFLFQKTMHRTHLKLFLWWWHHLWPLHGLSFCFLLIVLVTMKFKKLSHSVFFFSASHDRDDIQWSVCSCSLLGIYRQADCGSFHFIHWQRCRAAKNRVCHTHYCYHCWNALPTT